MIKLKNLAMIHRCRVCHSENLISTINLGSLYLSDFRNDNRKPKRYPLHLVLCKKCSLVQLKHTTPARALYNKNYGYKSGINKTMKTELRDVVEKSLKLVDAHSSLTVIDIGANDGTLLMNYPKNHFRIGVEPIKKFALECKKNADVVINDFFSAKSYGKKINKKADIITAISCFYDINNPVKFVKDVRSILKKDGIFVIQQNYLVDMIRSNAFDNIVHEHLEYYSLASLEFLLKIADLEIFDVSQSALNGGSFRTYIVHKGTRPINPSVQALRNDEREIRLNTKKAYKHFVQNIKDNGYELKKFIENKVKSGNRIFVYGASTRGNTLLQYYGLNNTLISAAAERNPEKWNKKISSVGIPIISEEQARKEHPEYMLVLPWFFKDEFLARESHYLQKGGHLIFPLPKMEII